MRRLERLLSEARALRVSRALRAQGRVPADRRVEWIEEVLAGQGLVEPLLASGEDGEAPVLDIAVLVPFMRRALEAVDAVFDEMRPDLAVGALVAEAAIRGSGLVGDLARTRQAAAGDLGMLAAEASLLSVVEAVIHGHDRARKTRLRAGRRDVVVEPGRIRRVRARPAASASLAAAGRIGAGLLDPGPGQSQATSDPATPDAGP